MSKPNYTEEQLNWAKAELQKKGIENPTQEQAVDLLNTFDDFGKMVTDKIEEDKKSGKLPEKDDPSVN